MTDNDKKKYGQRVCFAKRHASLDNLLSLSSFLILFQYANLPGFFIKPALGTIPDVCLFVPKKVVKALHEEKT